MKEDKEICVFCKIFEGSLESSIVFEDEYCAAFMDIRPVNTGHLLIVPKKHISYITEEDSLISAHLMKVATRIQGAVQKSQIKQEGFNYLIANGEAAGQEVFHVHLHLIPRYSGDGFGFQFSPEYGKIAERDKLDAIADEIKKQL
ncbi:MAG: HIT family protein [Bacteroidia bacterium]